MTAGPPPVTVIGARVPRREDAALLTGRGRFIDDVDRAHQVHAWIVRSPHAHARIVSIDTRDAAARRGSSRYSPIAIRRRTASHR